MFSIDIARDIGELELRIQIPPADGTTAIIGPNGAGKTTLLRCLLGAVAPDSGHISLCDKTLFHREAADSAHSSKTTCCNVAIEDRRIGYVPQRYALFENMTAAQNVGFGIPNRQQRATQAAKLLSALGVEHVSTRRVHRLSGGEAQRVALARALAIQPAALLLDEPMAALDASARRDVRVFLRQRLDEFALPTFIVSHDVADAETLADRVVVLENGQVAQIGPLSELRSNPATDFVDEFLNGTC